MASLHPFTAQPVGKLPKTMGLTHHGHREWVASPSYAEHVGIAAWPVVHWIGAMRQRLLPPPFAPGAGYTYQSRT
jgi:hypothetical protein